MAIDLSALTSMYNQGNDLNYKGDLEGSLRLGSAIKSSIDYNKMKNLIQGNINPDTGVLDYDTVYKKLLASGDLDEANKIYAQGKARKDALAGEQLKTDLITGKQVSPEVPGIPAQPATLGTTYQPGFFGNSAVQSFAQDVLPIKEDTNQPMIMAPSDKNAPSVTPEMNAPIPATDTSMVDKDAVPEVPAKYTPYTDDETLDKLFFSNQMTPKEYFLAKKELKDKSSKETESQRKEAIINNAFTTAVGSISDPNSVYSKALNVYSSAKTIDDKQKAQDMVRSAILSNPNIDDATKDILDESLKKKFFVPQPSQAEIIARVVKANADQLPGKVAASVLEKAQKDLNDFNAENADTQTYYDTINKHLDNGDYTWLATVSRPSGFSGNFIDLFKTLNLTPDQQELSDAAGQLYNKYKKLNAGTAVSPSEKSAIDNVFGNGIFHNAEAFKKGVGLMKKAIEARKAVLEANASGTTPHPKKTKKTASDWTKDL
jgi:hypothetical protein